MSRGCSRAWSRGRIGQRVFLGFLMLLIAIWISVAKGLLMGRIDQANRAFLKRFRDAMDEGRHTAATLLLLQGAPLAVVAAWLGHANADVTLRVYAHAQKQAIEAAAATFQGLYGKKPAGESKAE